MARMTLLENCEKHFSQLFRWKNAKGNGLQVGWETFPEKRGQNRAAFLARCPSL